MKDLLNVQDYLFSPLDVGDWEGEEELVCERLNELIHFAWARLPEDLGCEQIDNIITEIWEQLRGDLALVDAEFDELLDWLNHYVDSALDEQI